MPAADRGPAAGAPPPGLLSGGPDRAICVSGGLAPARWEGRPGRGDLNGTGNKRRIQAETETSRDESDGEGQGCGEGAVGQNRQGGGRHRGGSSGQVGDPTSGRTRRTRTK